MKVLLDTHIPLWYQASDERLGKKFCKIIEDSGNELYISVISIWEMHILAEKKRITLLPDVDEWCQQLISKMRIKVIDVSLPIIQASRRLNFDHEDPADRFIGATSYVHNLHLMSADEKLSNLSWVKGIKT